MAGHVFISYSRADRTYVDRLAAHLTAAGFEVWYDYELAGGDRFDKVIKEKIDTCVAFVAVMTPEADESHWVGVEVIYALTHSKPIVPLLLRGEVFMALITIEYDDVRGGRLPSDRFRARIAGLARSAIRPGGEAAPAARLGSPPARPPSARASRRYPDRQLEADELIVLRLRQRWNGLFRPAVNGAIAIAGAVVAGTYASGWFRYAAVAFLALVFAGRTLTPYLRWRSTHYVFTTKRLFLRSGVLQVVQQSIPYNRINDFTTAQTVLDRILGSGTVWIDSAGYEQIVLAHVPRLLKVESLIRHLLSDDERERTEGRRRG